MVRSAVKNKTKNQKESKKKFQYFTQQAWLAPFRHAEQFH